jgi:hypothetical protein
MAGYIGLIAGQWGIPVVFLVMILIWSAVWKLLALWKAGRKNSLVWFIVLALVNTLGILEILYIYIFSEMKPSRAQPRRRRR